MELLTINEAATLSGRSVQTIRRMIKRRKIQVKKQKTPQGFNYLIIKGTLNDFLASNQEDDGDDVVIQPTSREHRTISSDTSFPTFPTFQKELDRLTMTIQKMVEQGEKDKGNFFNLIKTFQDRIVNLEEQIKLLEAPKKEESSWWQFWK